MFFRKKFTLLFCEVFGDREPADAAVDVVRYNHARIPVPGALRRDSDTIVLDLTERDDRLFDCFKKDTRNEIRRAERDGVRYQAWLDSPAAAAEFSAFHLRVSAASRLPKLNAGRFRAMAEAGGLFVSRAGTPESGALVWHAYYISALCAYLVHSVSPAALQADAAGRSGIGRANRLHHWRDIQELKRLGVRCYDFGGYSADSRNPKRLGISRFKQEFGGAVVRQYTFLKGVSQLGRLFTAIYGRLNDYSPPISRAASCGPSMNRNL